MPLVLSSSEYIFSSVTLAISTQDTLSHFSASFSWELRSADFGCLLINTVIPRILIGSHIFQVNWYYRHAALVTEIAQNHVWYFFSLGHSAMGYSGIWVWFVMPYCTVLIDFNRWTTVWLFGHQEEHVACKN